MLYDIRQLNFSYGRKPVLRGLDLSLEPGCFYGILGPNGCGKTTFLDILVRHRKPESGTLVFNGRGLDTLNARSMAREVALVPQNTSLPFPYTVAELVMMGRHPYIGRFSSPSCDDLMAVDRAMDDADMKNLAHQPVTDLSGGERQRAFFARALAQDTPVLMLDEATASLDIKHSLSLLETVKRQVREKGKTVIAVFHDINLAALFCDRLIVMKQGRVFAEGETPAVLTESLISDVYGVKARVTDDDYTGTRHVHFRSEVNG
jgi:iron complex transport system ATP-binding protein